MKKNQYQIAVFQKFGEEGALLHLGDLKSLRQNAGTKPLRVPLHRDVVQQLVKNVELLTEVDVLVERVFDELTELYGEHLTSVRLPKKGAFKRRTVIDCYPPNTVPIVHTYG